MILRVFLGGGIIFNHHRSVFVNAYSPFQYLLNGGLTTDHTLSNTGLVGRLKNPQEQECYIFNSKLLLLIYMHHYATKFFICGQHKNVL